MPSEPVPYDMGCIMVARLLVNWLLGSFIKSAYLQGKRAVSGPSVVINAEKNVFGLMGDMMGLLERAAMETIPPFRDDKAADALTSRNAQVRLLYFCCRLRGRGCHFKAVMCIPAVLEENDNEGFNLLCRTRTTTARISSSGTSGAWPIWAAELSRCLLCRTCSSGCRYVLCCSVP